MNKTLLVLGCQHLLFLDIVSPLARSASRLFYRGGMVLSFLPPIFPKQGPLALIDDHFTEIVPYSFRVMAPPPPTKTSAKPLLQGSVLSLLEADSPPPVT